MVVCLRCLLHHILSLIAYTFRETGNLFSLLLCSLWWVQISGYILACRSYSFVCLIWRHWTYKMPVRYIISSVWVRLSILYMCVCVCVCVCGGGGAVCFQFTHFSCDDWYNIYTLSYYHHQIGSMNYYPLFRVRSWNNGVRCMSFYILIGSDNRLPSFQGYAFTLLLIGP